MKQVILNLKNPLCWFRQIAIPTLLASIIALAGLGIHDQIQDQQQACDRRAAINEALTVVLPEELTEALVTATPAEGRNPEAAKAFQDDLSERMAERLEILEPLEC